METLYSNGYCGSTGFNQLNRIQNVWNVDNHRADFADVIDL